MPSTIAELETVLRRRREHQAPPGSYSATLFEDTELLQRKVIEEAFEVCLELGRAERRPERIVAETADLLFHVLVGLVASDVPFEEVLTELDRRRQP